MNVIFDLNNILGWVISLSSGSEYFINGALNVVDLTIFLLFENIESYQSDLMGVLIK